MTVKKNATKTSATETRGHHKDPAAVKLGRKGGESRAKKMTAKQRSEAARKASLARWRPD